MDDQMPATAEDYAAAIEAAREAIARLTRERDEALQRVYARGHALAALTEQERLIRESLTRERDEAREERDGARIRRIAAEEARDAIRLATIEECAGVCDGQADSYVAAAQASAGDDLVERNNYARAYVARSCAGKLRALAGGGGGA